jgi:adenosylcobinamide-GDP ribazoletransferase
MRFFIALQFLTIIPVRIKRIFGDKELAQSMFFFPFVGIVLGLALAGMQQAASLVFTVQVTSIMLVTVLAVLTGGLHLDGIADTADALFSCKDRNEKLRIMKDSRIGAMGAAALALTILLKASLVASIPSAIVVPTLIFFPAAGRCGQLLPALIYRYARGEVSTGSFITKLSLRTVLPAFLLMMLLSAGLLQLSGICALAVVLAASMLAGKFIAAKLGGMTGDALGAINEGCEIVFLGAVCATAGCDLLQL